MKNIDDKEREKKCKKAFFSHRAEIGKFWLAHHFCYISKEHKKFSTM